MSVRYRGDLSLATEHDRREIAAFQRFLALGVSPYEADRIWREFPGWVPYVLGFGPAPAPGQDDVPVCGWSLPG